MSTKDTFQAQGAIAVVIPALNEEKTIGDVVRRAAVFGKVIVVDDGSTDGTAKEAEKNGATVVTHNVNQGYDRALLSGFKQADAEGARVVITLDADGQHLPETLPEMTQPLLDNKADVALAIRPEPARFAEAVFRNIAKKNWGIGDILCGMKAYRIDMIRAYGYCFIEPTFGTAAAICMVKNGARMIQTNIDIRNREDTPRIGRLIRANYRLFKGMVIALKLAKDSSAAHAKKAA